MVDQQEKLFQNPHPIDFRHIEEEQKQMIVNMLNKYHLKTTNNLTKQVYIYYAINAGNLQNNSEVAQHLVHL